MGRIPSWCSFQCAIQGVSPEAKSNLKTKKESEMTAFQEDLQDAFCLLVGLCLPTFLSYMCCRKQR